ncbi:LytR/AlgR family response regulator transcription factor [Lewinella sp. IMCC34183]|uniref:LytR/AlgR family response regulator transcription factor n=1 Tax=Lewinella sp. IMCC34183 TaxID=2248762 RepID=UPI000E2867FD|nr:response regulator transcription factor [Lewinella sp. IMCC34183]
MNTQDEKIFQPEKCLRPAKATVLVVEDELIIADFLRRALEKDNYRVVHAISYEEAVKAIKQSPPGAALLDIRLSDHRSGVDVAHYLSNLPVAVPFIYLTAQVDTPTLNEAKVTRPAAYLEKPVRLTSLLSTLEVALYNARTARNNAPALELRHDGTNYRVAVRDIDYLQAEGVYVRVFLTSGRTLLQRAALSTMLATIGNTRFAQTHRSFAVNLDRVTAYNSTGVRVGETQIPVSRNRSREIRRLLGCSDGGQRALLLG